MMKATLDDQIEHGFQDGFPFIAFGSHSSAVECSFYYP
jgi:hypothetical protein